MNTLRFHTSLYEPSAISDAVEMFADFGAFDWNTEPADGYYDVTVTAAEDVDPADLAGEFGNVVLVNTIESRGGTE